MPLYEYGCYSCEKVSETLVRVSSSIPSTVQCDHCGSHDTVKLISQINYRVHKKAKYDDEFLGRVMPAMKKKKETAQYFAEGPKGSDEAKMFEMGEQIGTKIDRMIQRSLPKK